VDSAGGVVDAEDVGDEVDLLDKLLSTSIGVANSTLVGEFVSVSQSKAVKVVPGASAVVNCHVRQYGAAD
jgi:hypothetical protein